MTATATLVHTSSRASDNALRVARVAAAGRVAADRKAREAREAARYARVTDLALSWVEDLRAAGAVEVGFKVCLTDGGKWRGRVALEDAATFVVCSAMEQEDCEAWGIRADGEYCADVW